MKIEEYLADPCGASSLPYWKTVSLIFPENVAVIRDDMFSGDLHGGRDERYFKLMHDLKNVKKPLLPEGFEAAQCGIGEHVRLIEACYDRERVSEEELSAYMTRPVYRPELWIALADSETGKIAASGIAELDAGIGEGVLEWIQVLPEYRRKGLGSFIVNELLIRMRGHARFVTVSGRVNNSSRPFELYTACGFSDPVIWHIVTE